MNYFSYFSFDFSIIVSVLLITAFILNVVFGFIIIFLEHREAGAIWAWLLVLLFVPILGFILYLLFGRQIQRKSIFNLDEQDKIGLEHIINEQIKAIDENNFEIDKPEISNYKHLIHMLLYNNSAFLTTDNKVEMFTDGHDKFDALIEDIRKAESYIHIQYYIFKKDNLGKKILFELEKKLQEGLEVKMLYDDMGSRKLNLSSFKKFRAQGGEVASFFPSKLPLINFRMNNRNHRKIVVIDGKVGYVGGFNVGDEYLGLDKKFGYWRDTHLRLEGDSVNALQLRFMLDWNSQSTRDKMRYEPKYFPDVESGGKVGIQIASSGPDEEWEQIKYGYLKMISEAKKHIYIQTPYFIPDLSFLDAIKIAALSGVDVNVMIPNKPDHPFVYWATFANVGELIKAGVKVHIYEKGFIHTKMVAIDDEVVSIGTANMDNRSFVLNFEVNAFIYDEEIAKNSRLAYENDMTNSSLLTVERYENRSTWIKLKEGIARLLSPLL